MAPISSREHKTTSPGTRVSVSQPARGGEGGGLQSNSVIGCADVSGSAHVSIAQVSVLSLFVFVNGVKIFRLVDSSVYVCKQKIFYRKLMWLL